MAEMNRSTCRQLFVLQILACVTPGGQSLAQPLECGADDAQCLEDAWVLACGSESDFASCLAWVKAVEAHALANNPEWRLISALGYTSVASFSGSQSEKQFYWEQSGSVFREVIARWSDRGRYAAQANIGLAGLAVDANEAISLLRAAMRADPSNENTPYLLASRLAARGRIDDYSEAADLYRRAYYSWSGYYSAANALRLYELSGQTDKAENFRLDVERESDMVDFATEVLSPQFSQNLAHAEEVFETACESNIIAIFGPETCANGIDTLVAATRSTNYLPVRRNTADVATQAMKMLIVAGDGTTEARNQNESEFGSILREWIDTEAATAAVYVLWAQNIMSDLDESVSALEQAVKLAPDNGQYRYWLAQGYIEKGRFDEAIENLSIARDTLPENMGLTPELVDAQISRAESARELRR